MTRSDSAPETSGTLMVLPSPIYNFLSRQATSLGQLDKNLTLNQTLDAESKLSGSRKCLGISSRNTQEGTANAQRACVIPLQASEQTKRSDIESEPAFATTWTSAPAEFTLYQLIQSAATSKSSFQRPSQDTSNPTHVSAGRSQLPDSPISGIQRLSAKPKAPVPSKWLPLLSSPSQLTPPNDPTVCAFIPLSAEPASSPVPSSESTKPAAFVSNEVREVLDGRSQPALPKTPVNPALRPSSASSTNPPLAFPPSLESMPPSTPQCNCGSTSTNTGFNYTPPIFGVPSTVLQCHGKVKSPFTAGLTGSSPSFAVSYKSRTNIWRTKLGGRKGGTEAVKDVAKEGVNRSEESGEIRAEEAQHSKA